jgi:hypothetical protein
MAGRMMASDKNRSKNKVDNRYDDDGFWMHRRFKAHRRTGAATGGRGWRRAIRTKEQREVTREVRSEMD